MRAKIPNLTGRTFSRLTALRIADRRSADGRLMYECSCSCGALVVVVGKRLWSGDAKSCGCIHAEGLNRRHGYSHTPLHDCWIGMRKRCRNPKSNSYKNYGARGIRVCERWERFENFLQDMGPSFREGLALDRINNDGNYEPGNCRWATLSQNARNKRNTKIITIHGVRKPLASFAEEHGINRYTLLSRVTNEWSESDLLLPVNQAAPRMRRGERHHRAKLSMEDVRDCRRRHSDGVSCRALAKEFGVDPSTMHSAVRGKTWACATPSPESAG